MEDIIDTIIIKNNDVKFVVNAVTPETLSETLRICQKIKRTPDIVQVFAARGEKAGSSTIMRALNPVYIISF